MVTLNLTLFVTLGLFLVFLWLEHKLVFKPLLALMDKREQKLLEDKQTAANLEEEARALEARYARELGALHRHATQELSEAHRRAMEEHANRAEELHHKADKEIVALRHELRDQFKVERKRAPEFAATLISDIERAVGIKDGAR